MFVGSSFVVDGFSNQAQLTRCTNNAITMRACDTGTCAPSIQLLGLRFPLADVAVLRGVTVVTRGAGLCAFRTRFVSEAVRGVESTEAADRAVADYTRASGGRSELWGVSAEFFEQGFGVQLVAADEAVAGCTLDCVSLRYTYDVRPSLQMLVPMQANWKFWFEQVPRDWAQRQFGDHEWPIGAAPFGRRDEYEFATDVNAYVLPAQPVFHFRAPFTAEELPCSNLLVHAYISDGFVLYIDGYEFFRFNLPAGPLSASSRAVAPFATVHAIDVTEIVGFQGWLTGSPSHVLSAAVFVSDPQRKAVFDLSIIRKPTSCASTTLAAPPPPSSTAAQAPQTTMTLVDGSTAAGGPATSTTNSAERATTLLKIVRNTRGPTTAPFAPTTATSSNPLIDGNGSGIFKAILVAVGGGCVGLLVCAFCLLCFMRFKRSKASYVSDTEREARKMTQTTAEATAKMYLDNNNSIDLVPESQQKTAAAPPGYTSVAPEPVIVYDVGISTNPYERAPPLEF